jgi:hypothetical protein
MPSLHGPCLALDLRLGKTRSMLEVMLRTEALVNFALDHFSRCDYDHDSIAKCPYCGAWRFSSWQGTTPRQTQVGKRSLRSRPNQPVDRDPPYRRASRPVHR